MDINTCNLEDVFVAQSAEDVYIKLLSCNTCTSDACMYIKCVCVWMIKLILSYEAVPFPNVELVLDSGPGAS